MIEQTFAVEGLDAHGQWSLVGVSEGGHQLNPSDTMVEAAKLLGELIEAKETVAGFSWQGLRITKVSKEVVCQSPDMAVDATISDVRNALHILNAQLFGLFETIGNNRPALLALDEARKCISRGLHDLRRVQSRLSDEVAQENDATAKPDDQQRGF